MNYAVLTNIGQIDSVDFIPTVIVGFYESGKEKLFSQYSETLKARFPDVDIIGCSSESNIYDSIPYVDLGQTHTCIYMCIEMKKGSYRLQLFPDQKKQKIFVEENKKYSAIVLSSHYSNDLEQIITLLQEDIAKNSFFGAIAGAKLSTFKEGSIFYNGEYISDGILLWLIDQEEYSLKGISAHDFDPVGFDLEITRTEGFQIIEIENQPALDMIENMIGTLSLQIIESYDQPFFITSFKNHDHSFKKPVSSIKSIDREAKTITLFKKVSKGDKLKLAIPFSREKQINQLDNFSHFVTNGSIAFLFTCVAYKGHWGEMEPIYIMRLAKNINIPFIGLHAFGEIGPLDTKDLSVLQNQTLTLAVLTEKQGRT
ncbi:MAG: hypothetical protein P794_05170 [Epsilonproteobacteria bacterium (ex Lamellibrachia satsuma)]|nr:MAG: hypothetical protein P794_05170 [Epsilonproteobacteria bacterium (ex Lamellibrachia satsuma)]